MCYQRDLLVRERADFSSIDADATNRQLIMNHRDREECADAPFISTGYQHLIAFNVAFLLANIGYVDWTSSSYRAGRGRGWSWPKSGSQNFEERRWYSKRDDRLDNAVG